MTATCARMGPRQLGLIRFVHVVCALAAGAWVAMNTFLDAGRSELEVIFGWQGGTMASLTRALLVGGVCQLPP